MNERAARFGERAAETYGLDIAVEEFPEGTKTAEDAAAAIGCAVAQIASAIVLAADTPVVVVTSGANRVDTRKLATLRGVHQARMADPEEVRDATGYAIGGVPPLCHDDDLPVYLDETLTDFETVWAAAGTPEAVFPIAPEAIVEHADAEVADVAE
ncbi:Cys-tRNA(Pro) deacylase [Halovenus aranensis]|uniref:Cys-tRNA(Pro) deacylase n=1 Tax=Halovenus aranensis TaxID=890420 RepID=A0A1G8Y1G2_9EURY|nr:YbaK/EbsC family protein [Halovenus aranensis]SDJ96547.1 Cys-tRNA(Pro) deacylase [Halovenus aranensis]